MGILDFFKKPTQTTEKSTLIKEEHVTHKNLKKPIKRRSITEDEFNNQQFQRETMVFAIWKYKENNNDYLAAHKCLTEMEGIDLTEKQVNAIIETLKLWNNLKSRKDRFNDLVNKSQILVNEAQKVQAFELVYNAYVEDPSDIKLVELITQIADMYNNQEVVLEIFDKLTIVNPDDSYNIKYRKALYFKTKLRFNEAIRVFESLNAELQFAWNYYQIAIIQNLLGDIDSCLENLRKTFELDPNLKQDAKDFVELKNLQQDTRFVLLTK